MNITTTPSHKKERIDLLLIERGLVKSRAEGQSLILAGSVFVNGKLSCKPGTQVSPLSEITLKERSPYVSRGGLKLRHALKQFDVSPDGFICLDVGSSHGGFTDCLLQGGAQKIYAVDVGQGIMTWKLRQDPRLILFEGANFRNFDLSLIPQKIDLAVIDVSFISLDKILPNVFKLVKSGGQIIPLIKPQFEVGKGKVGKGGIVRDPQLHRDSIAKISYFCENFGKQVIAVCPSPLKGAKGNQEFFLHVRN